jgi:hypothetical protein
MATGHQSFRIVAPLSGGIKENKFRLTLPPGFNYPLQPILIGKVVQNGFESDISYSFTTPWLGVVALVTVWLVLVSMVWPDLKSVSVSTLMIFVVLVLFIGMRKSDKKKLLNELFARLENENV